MPNPRIKCLKSTATYFLICAVLSVHITSATATSLSGQAQGNSQSETKGQRRKRVARAILNSQLNITHDQFGRVITAIATPPDYAGLPFSPATLSIEYDANNHVQAAVSDKGYRLEFDEKHGLRRMIAPDGTSFAVDHDAAHRHIRIMRQSSSAGVAPTGSKTAAFQNVVYTEVQQTSSCLYALSLAASAYTVAALVCMGLLPGDCLEWLDYASAVLEWSLAVCEGDFSNYYCDYCDRYYNGYYDYDYNCPDCDFWELDEMSQATPLSLKEQVNILSELQVFASTKYIMSTVVEFGM